MVTDFLLGFVEFVINLFPPWSPSWTIAPIIEDMMGEPIVAQALGVMGYVDHYMPVSEALGLLLLTASMLGSYMVYQIVMWIYKRIPMKGT